MLNETPITTFPPINEYGMDGYDFTWIEQTENEVIQYGRPYAYHPDPADILNTTGTSQINITQNISIDHWNIDLMAISTLSAIISFLSLLLTPEKDIALILLSSLCMALSGLSFYFIYQGYRSW